MTDWVEPNPNGYYRTECERCGEMFDPEPPNWYNGFDADIYCEECCNQLNEEQFLRNEIERCGGDDG